MYIYIYICISLSLYIYIYTHNFVYTLRYVLLYYTIPEYIKLPHEAVRVGVRGRTVGLIGDERATSFFSFSLGRWPGQARPGHDTTYITETYITTAVQHCRRGTAR